MSVIKRMRKQKAVWWKRGTPDQFGAFTFETPVEIDCRWDGQGAEFRNRQGQTEMSNSVVWPDRVLSVGDKLKEGPMNSETPEDPTDDLLAFEIQRVDKTPNFKATEFLHTVYL